MTEGVRTGAAAGHGLCEAIFIVPNQAMIVRPTNLIASAPAACDVSKALAQLYSSILIQKGVSSI